jgi:hypothetical protein
MDEARHDAAQWADTQPLEGAWRETSFLSTMASSLDAVPSQPARL